MAQYTVELEGFRLISPRNRRPYWDEVVITAHVAGLRWVPNSSGVPEEVPFPRTASKSAWLGLMGSGAYIDLRSVKPVGADNWEFEIPDPEPGERLVVHVAATNVRDLGKQETERLIGEAAIIAAEIVAGLALEPATHLGKVVVAGALGLYGWSLDKLVGELFKDKPNCHGEIVTMQCACDPDDLENELEQGVSDWHLHQVKADGERLSTKTRSVPGYAGAVGDCGAPAAATTFKFTRKEQLVFPRTTFQEAISETRRVKIDEISRQWAPWLDTGSPKRVLVTVARSQGGKDAVDIALTERILASEQGPETVLLNEQYPDLLIESRNSLLPGADVFGKLKLLDKIVGLIKGPPVGGIARPYPVSLGAAVGTMAMAVTEPVASGISSVAEFGPQRALELYDRKLQLDLDRFIVDELYEPVFYSLFRQTKVIVVPNGVILSFWKRVMRDQSGNLLKEDLIMRYWRNSNSQATTTDCWLSPAVTIA